MNRFPSLILVPLLLALGLSAQVFAQDAPEKDPPGQAAPKPAKDAPELDDGGDEGLDDGGLDEGDDELDEPMDEGLEDSEDLDDGFEEDEDLDAEEDLDLEDDMDLEGELDGEDGLGGLDDLDDLEGLDALEELDDLQALSSPGSEGGGEVGVDVREFKGFISSRAIIYGKDRNKKPNDERLIFEAQAEVDLRLTASLSAYFRPRFLIDALDNELYRFEPLEGYVTLTKDRFDLRVGQFIENWGVADTFNPLDVLNRRDFGVASLDQVRLGELGARFRYFFPDNETIGEPTLALYVMPIFRRTPFPTDEGRFTFTQQFTFPATRLREDEALEPRREERVFAAARATGTLSSSVANADLSVVVSRGPTRIPFLQPQIIPGSLIINLQQIYFGMWTVGGGMRAVPNIEGLSSLTLKAEFAYNHPYRTRRGNYDLPEPYVQTVSGFDYLIPNVLKDNDQITLTIEYVQEAGSGADDISSRIRPFDADLVLRTLYELNDFDRTSLELIGVVDLENAEWIAGAVFERNLGMINENLKARFGVTYFDPKRTDTTFLANFPNNSNALVELRYDF